MIRADTHSNYWGTVVITACLYVIVVVPSPVKGQFIDLRLEIESKLDAETLQKLDFGVFSTNTGRQSISLGDVNMGVFSITALKNQILMVNFQTPDLLYHDNPAVRDTIPVNLQGRYGYMLNNPDNSQPLRNEMTIIEVDDTKQIGPWARIYIFVFGMLEIGDIPDGTYINRIELRVEYI